MTGHSELIDAGAEPPLLSPSLSLSQQPAEHLLLSTTTNDSSNTSSSSTSSSKGRRHQIRLVEVDGRQVQCWTTVTWQRLWLSDGTRGGQYKGDWAALCSREHKHTAQCHSMHGHGSFRNVETRVYYTGDFAASRMEGIGHLETSVFEYYGQMHRDRPHGKGIRRCKSDGSQFTGWLYNGSMAEGQMATALGLYVGSFKDEEPSGRGALFHPDSTSFRYVGDFLLGRPCGIGSFYSSDGSTSYLADVNSKGEERRLLGPFPPSSALKEAAAADHMMDDDDGQWTKHGDFYSDAAVCTTGLSSTGSRTAAAARPSPSQRSDPRRRSTRCGRRDSATPAACPTFLSVPDALEFCRRQHVCTAFATGGAAIRQFVFACESCMQRVEETRQQREMTDDDTERFAIIVLLCFQCAQLSRCHADHSLVPIGWCSLARCDCGRGQCSLMQPHHRKQINAARGAAAAFLSASSSRAASLRAASPGPVADADSESPLFAVEQIIGCQRLQGVKSYCIKWRGYSHAHDQLETAASFSDSVSSIGDWERLVKERKAWKAMPAAQRRRLPYPVPSPDEDIQRLQLAQRAVTVTAPSWSLVPVCPTLLSPALQQYPWRTFTQQEVDDMLAATATAALHSSDGRLDNVYTARLYSGSILSQALTV